MEDVGIDQVFNDLTCPSFPVAFEMEAELFCVPDGFHEIHCSREMKYCCLVCLLRFRLELMKSRQTWHSR